MKLITALVVVVVACWFAGPPVLKELALRKSPVCKEQGRVLSDRELADALIRQKFLGPAVSGSTGEVLRPGFGTVEAYRAAYPDCCKVLRWNGKGAGEASFKVTRFLEQSPLERLLKPYDVLIEDRLVDACGGVIGNAPGGGVL